MKKTNFTQTELLFSFSSKDSYASVFKKLYYHLYSNGNASRAEVIIEDLAKVLLIKLGLSKQGLNFIIDDYLQGNKSAEHYLLPIIRDKIPYLFADKEGFQLDEISIRRCFSELNSLEFNEGQSHVLGEAFQALIGPVLRGEKGQFFTPKSIVKAMVEIVNPQPNHRIIDPACGTGGFLLESYNYIQTKGNSFSGELIGIDKDNFLSKTTKLICEIYAPYHNTVFNANSLDIEWLNRNALELNSVDVVLTNPPFGAKIGITDTLILKQYDLGYNWAFVNSENRWIKTNQLLSSQDPQTLFIELCVRVLKEDGIMGMVLPEGIFGNRTTGYIWDYLRANGEIVALLDCPRTAFQPSTDVKTNILFYRKKAGGNIYHNFKIATATYCGHDRRGRSVTEQGQPYPDDFPLIASGFHQPKVEIWQEAIVKNPYYLVPRYCDASVEKQLHETFQGDILSLGEMIRRQYISIRKGDEVGSEAYGTGNIPFIRTSDISNLEITSDPTKSVSEEVYAKYRYSQDIRECDILMIADGRYRIGKSAIVLGESTKCVVQSHLKIIRVLNNAPFSAFELLYILNQPSVQRQIRNLIFIQSTLGSLGSRLNELLLPVPNKTYDWIEKVTSFEQILRQRRSLLEQLKGFQQEELTDA